MVLAVAALPACSKAPSHMPTPDPPSMFTRPAEYAFGDTIGAADAAATNRVIDALKPHYGHPEVTRYTAPADADFVALKAYYDTRAAAAGWSPILQLGRGLPAGEQAIGYAADGTAFAVVWLKPRADSPITPVNVIRFSN